MELNLCRTRLGNVGRELIQLIDRGRRNELVIVETRAITTHVSTETDHRSISGK